MSRDAWPTESSPPELPQPTRITNFTRLGTELSLRAATRLLPLCLSLLAEGITGKSKDPNPPYHHQLDSNTRKFPAASAEQETYPAFSTAVSAVVLLAARF